MIERVTSSPFQDAQVTFTGKLASMTRPRAEQLVRAAGGKPVPSVSRSTTMLVVGMLGWPLLPNGRVSRKLERAEQLQAQGVAVNIISEARFLESAGQQRGQNDLWKSYPADEVCRLLQIEPSTLQKWERFSLVRSHEGLYDFQDLVSMQTIGQLVSKGIRAETISASLRGLASVLPGTERPLAQLRIIAQDPKSLLADFGDYLLAPTGQMEFTFERAAPHPPTPLPHARAGAEPSADPSEWFDYARACEQAEEFSEAAEAYRKTLALHPEFPEAHFNLGNVLRELGRPEEALQSYQRAIDVDPRLAVAHYNLADLSMEREETAQAIEHLERALAIDPTYADAHFNLALCLEQANRFESASQHWRTYLNLDPSGAWADIARQHLARLSLS
jgi:tetratricopeptide (TPR) repeat protein